jgi:hypothetical protein
MKDAPDIPVERTGADADFGPPSRSIFRSVLVGIALAVGLGAITFFLIAIPFYTLASFESNGIDRPIVRTGLFRVALPVGALVGVVGGVLAARWLHRGGRWVVEDDGDRYSAR